MPQADGYHNLSRMELAYGDKSFQFNINPQTLKTTSPHRTSVLKTQGNYVVEDFNADVQTLELSGTTGGARSNGYEVAIQLWNFLEGYSMQADNYGETPEYLTFYNHTDDYAWDVVLAPEGFSWERSAERPLLWDYSIKFYVIDYAGINHDPGLVTHSEIITTDANRTTQRATIDRKYGFPDNTVSGQSKAGFSRALQTILG